MESVRNVTHVRNIKDSVLPACWQTGKAKFLTGYKENEKRFAYCGPISMWMRIGELEEEIKRLESESDEGR